MGKWTKGRGRIGVWVMMILMQQRMGEVRLTDTGDCHPSSMSLGRYQYFLGV